MWLTEAKIGLLKEIETQKKYSYFLFLPYPFIFIGLAFLVMPFFLPFLWYISILRFSIFKFTM